MVLIEVYKVLIFYHFHVCVYIYIPWLGDVKIPKWTSGGQWHLHDSYLEQMLSGLDAAHFNYTCNIYVTCVTSLANIDPCIQLNFLKKLWFIGHDMMGFNEHHVSLLRRPVKTTLWSLLVYVPQTDKSQYYDYIWHYISCLFV